MRLNDIIKETTESQEELADRCMFMTENWQNTKVAIFSSVKEKHTPKSKPIEIVSVQEFHKKLRLLDRKEPESYLYPEIKLDPKCVHDKGLTKVEEEAIDCEPDYCKWICNICGEIIHEFKLKADIQRDVAGGE